MLETPTLDRNRPPGTAPIRPKDATSRARAGGEGRFLVRHCSADNSRITLSTYRLARGRRVHSSAVSSRQAARYSSEIRCRSATKLGSVPISEISCADGYTRVGCRALSRVFAGQNTLSGMRLRRPTPFGQPPSGRPHPASPTRRSCSPTSSPRRTSPQPLATRPGSTSFAGTMTPSVRSSSTTEARWCFRVGHVKCPPCPDLRMCWGRTPPGQACEWMTTLRPPSSVAVRVTVPLTPLPSNSTNLLSRSCRPRRSS